MKNSPPVITAYTLRHLLMCERRIWLDQHGDPTRRMELSPTQFAGGISHEEAVSAATFGPTTTVPAASWEQMVDATRDLMQRGVHAIRGAAFERKLHLAQPVTVRGRADWLRRVSQPSWLGSWSYEPVEIKLRPELNEEDQLQLDLYLWFLHDLQGSEPSGWFWLGRDSDNQPLQVIEHTYRHETLLAAIQRIGDVLAAEAAPPIYLATHCKSCHWHAFCEEAARRQQDCTLLSGLSRQTWEHLRAEGIHTLGQLLALSPDDLRRFKGVGKVKAGELYAHAQAIVTEQPVRMKPLPDPVRQPGIMLDLETRLDNGQVWCFGWTGADEQFRVAIVDRFYTGGDLQLPGGQAVTFVSNSDEGWRLVAEAAHECPGPVYHWSNFERAVLRATAPTDVIAVLDGRLHDLNRTFKQSYVLPVKGTSIKKVAPYFGFRWPEGTSALTAWDDYRAWLMEGNRTALARACAYNRADVEAMGVIWRWMLETSI